MAQGVFEDGVKLDWFVFGEWLVQAVDDPFVFAGVLHTRELALGYRVRGGLRRDWSNLLRRGGLARGGFWSFRAPGVFWPFRSFHDAGFVH